MKPRIVIVGLWAFMFCFNFLNAQGLKQIDQTFKGKKIDSPSLQFPVDYNREVRRNNINPLSSFKSLNIETLDKGEYSVKHRDVDGQILWVEGKLELAKSLSTEQKVAQWFDRAAKTMEIDLASTEFITQEEISVSNKQEKHVRVSQYHHGIKVYNAELMVHFLDDNKIESNGRYVKTKDLPEMPTKEVISKEEVQSSLIGNLDNYQEDHLADLKNIGINLNADRWQNELVYYKHDLDYRLAYHIEVYPHLAEHLVYFVDATTGETLRSYSNICKSHNGHSSSGSETKCVSHKNCKHTRTNQMLDGEAQADARDLLGAIRRINTYDVGGDYFLIDASRPMHNRVASNFPNDAVGVIWTIDMNNTSPARDGDFTHVVSGNNSWGNTPGGVSAHFNAGEAYEYFKNVHGRESISGNGQNIISFINVANEDGSSMGGAFWNGIGIHYGNGDSKFMEAGRGLDVAGHEMTHGVIQATANLEYYAEPGAINESMADIFGAMIDRDDWLMGEDITRSGKPLRNMRDPNNGAQTGDFRNDWQPSHYDERYLGELDNAGVHINSGIPNRAYYLFATATSKEVAEKVYYRALTTYLTRSSQFKDLRFAVVRSAQDLYGTNVANEAGLSFDQVGIRDQGSTSYEEDVEENPGDDLILFCDGQLSNAYIVNYSRQEFAFNPLTTTNIGSKPSITDDGSVIVFVGQNNLPYIIQIDWSSNPPRILDESTLDDNPIWKNIIISKDGNRVAAIFEEVSPIDDEQNRQVYVLDIPSNTDQTFELYNPTFSDGIRTGNVLYADAMEFDITGNYIMYDAYNSVASSSGVEINFWDIGFLEVWNEQNDGWALGNVQKLFSQLDEGESVGNPTFSKNSPYIIAMEYLDESAASPTVDVIGVNYESGNISTIFQNEVSNYPSYSNNDDQLIFDFFDDGTNSDRLAVVDLLDNKIDSQQGSGVFLFNAQIESQWGVWFSNGQRILSDIEELDVTEDIRLSPNPTKDFLDIALGSKLGNEVLLEIFNMDGRLLSAKKFFGKERIQMHVSNLIDGIYVLSVTSNQKVYSQQFVKN